ncbi:biotin-dependent carboxyltransferase family protein [Rouxiella badensis]|uniref:5-oxoprolinase subunit PxpC n=1 Tax=Rouxiella badensis TaxID=1646377 RepID=UPI001D156963|nr:5-oxoprolinase subunit PxpC [Rouxiella badensis]MCC3702334.1 biotin-dependent carboxyltransferase family protein [Rouxiella badensis]
MLKVLRAGMQTTVQDLGREGYRQLGVSQSGALDVPALRIANLLVGNDENAAGLEITLGQFSVQFTKKGWIALAGAGSHTTLDGVSLWTGWCYPVKAGQVLTMKMPMRGMRSYLAVAGGINVPEVLDSRSTDIKAGFGGFEGRALKDGDVLSVGKAVKEPQKSTGVKQLLFGNRIRAVPGPEYQEFSHDARESFWRTAWQLSPQSNRMGYRLHGHELTREIKREMLSHGLVPGVVQVPHGGQPIVLMADAQTTGGYPRIACVIEADLYHLAQIRLGMPIHFVKCTVEEALHAKREQDRFIEQIKWGLHER